MEQLPTAPASSAQAEPIEQPQISQASALQSDSSPAPDVMSEHIPHDTLRSTVDDPDSTEALSQNEALQQEAQPDLAANDEAPSDTGLLAQGEPTSNLPQEPAALASVDRPPSEVVSANALPAELSIEAPLDPAPAPAEATNVPTSAKQVQHVNTEQVLQDAPLSAKVGRAREEDTMPEEPIAKRPKMDDEESLQPVEFTRPNLPQIETATDEKQSDDRNSAAMTSLQQKELTKMHMSLKRLKDAIPFTKPVDPVALNIPTYFDIIERPMDLGTMETKIKAQEYTSVGAYVTDFEQIIANTKKFNGEAHTVTRNAYNLKAWFEKTLKAIPGPEQVEPVRAEKKKKAASPAPSKPLPARRESRSSLPGSARSPTTPSQAFGMNPATGTPIIRRDSTLAGDRPKREIQAPPPRDLPYATAKPQRKKFQTELKFCRKVLSELLKPKYTAMTWPFLKPVDPVAENLPTYHKIVRSPMDLGTVSTKLDSGQYENAKEFETDMRLIVKNCCLFNPVETLHYRLAKDLEREFEREWSTKRQWVQDHQPASLPQSAAASSDEEEEEEEEEEVVDEVDEKQAAIAKIQQQIMELSKELAEVGSDPNKGPKTKKGGVAKSAAKSSKKRASNSVAPVVPKAIPKKAKLGKKTREYPEDRKTALGEMVEKLPEKYMMSALTMVKERFLPELQDEDEIEIEIQKIPSDILWDLQAICDKAFPKKPQSKPARAKISAAQEETVSSKKKHKPMTKATQDQRIAEIQNTLSGYQQSRKSEDIPMQSVGEFFSSKPAESGGDIADFLQDNTDLGAEESSGDEDSEESEEE